MRIQSAALDMRAHHQFASARHDEVRERVTPLPRSTVAPVPTAPTAQPRVMATMQAPAPSDPPKAEPDDPLAHVEGRLRVLAALIERITGQVLRLAKAPVSPEEGVGGEAPPAASTPPTRPGEAVQDGPVRIDRSALSLRMEYEAVTFQAQGMVQTADGHSISFELGFTLERSFFELTAVSSSEVRERLKDPLVISLNGPAALGAGRFGFDLDADGQAENLPGLAAGQGFLALDRNGDGRINDGRELFGATSGDGFAELSSLDGDGNGWIDAGDAAFDRLRVWLDAGSGGGRLASLRELGIGALSLTALATPFERRDADQTLLAKLRQSGVWLAEDGRAGLIQQLDLAV
ncbi:MAG: hypothetical protein AB1340_08250 [Pseudomonadota bacterium]